MRRLKLFEKLSNVQNVKWSLIAPLCIQILKKNYWKLGSSVTPQFASDVSLSLLEKSPGPIVAPFKCYGNPLRDPSFEVQTHAEKTKIVSETQNATNNAERPSS